MRTLATLLSGLYLAGSLPAATVPRPSPEMIIQRYNQPAMQLSQFKGKIVALAFIHTTCSHCQDLTRVLKVIQKDYAARNVTVVACAFEEGAAQNFLGYLKALDPNFPAGIAPPDAVMKYLGWDQKRDGMLMIPHMVFLDAKGVIRGDFDGKDGFYSKMDENVRKQLDKMTTGATAAPAKAAPKKK
ncbi:MAG: TlpA disulfide reductase family protein [Candidatus Solibacter sp.]